MTNNRQAGCDYLIWAGNQSPGAEGKKKHYKKALQRELDGLDDEFSTLKFLAQELQVRTNSIRFQKAA